MTYSELAALMGWSARTAQRYLEAWYAAQARPDVPRVTVERTGGRGRPRYVVDRATLSGLSRRAA